VELVFSLPTDHPHDVIAYFTACAKWAGAVFGGLDNIISADIHRDEAQDHAHVLLLPLFEGRLRGSDAVGNKKKLSELQAKFFKEVAEGFGFSKPRARLSGINKAQATRQVLDKLRQDPAAKSAAWAVIRDSVERDPMSYALALGIVITDNPSKPGKTMTQIFTSKGKGKDKPIGIQPKKPNRVSRSPEAQTLGHCRESISPPPPKTPTAPEDTSNVDHIIRVRDSELDPANYDPDTGEFYSTPTSPA
jgi:hypothetical protein